jgi:glucose/arabinose dehydrogenase
MASHLRSRMHFWPFSLVIVLGVAPVLADESTIFAPIQPLGGVRIELSKVASGFTSPLKAKTAPGEEGRLYVVDQVGKLWAVDLAHGAKTLFFDLGDRLVPLGVDGPGSYDERGFLGVAFHPNYRKNGKLYTWTSEPNHGAPTFPTTLPRTHAADHQNVLAEWTAISPGNPAAGVKHNSRRELMRIDWPQFNHDAGDLTFGPDGKLYLPTGDGGGTDDADNGEDFDDLVLGHPAPVVGHDHGNAQRLDRILGKILRIDVDGHNSRNGRYGIPKNNPFVNRGGALDEIYAYGFRHPYRISFDQATGALYAADVGQNDLEEVDLVVAGGNYGWHLKEGALCFDPRGTEEGIATPRCPPHLPGDLIDPIAQYDTDTEGHAIIGGFVYRGSKIPALVGHYFFGDWSAVFNDEGPNDFGRLFYLQQTTFPPGKLAEIKEVANLQEEADELGLTDPAQPPAPFPQTIAVTGFGQDDSGEIYVLGNRIGFPTGNDGVVLRLGRERKR